MRKTEKNLQDPTYEEKLMWVRDRILTKGERRAERKNSSRSVTRFQVGESVFVKACNLSNKFLKQSAKFMAVNEGPYVIERVLGKGAYLLKERGMFNVKDLKRVHTK